MTITAIRLQNFMAFGEVKDDNEGWIELRRISLLYGRNSSGKSTIIRALRLLKQSLTETPKGAKLAFNVEDGLNAGNHLSIIHGSDLKEFSYNAEIDNWEEKKTVDFAFAISIPSTRLSYYLHSSELTTGCKLVQFTLRFGWFETEEVFDLISFTLEVPLHNSTKNYVIFEGGRLPQNALAEEMGDWWFGSDSLTDSTNLDDLSIWRTQEIWFTHGFLPNLSTPRIALRWIPNDHSITHISKLLEDINGEIATFLSNIQYIRPIRPEPQRDFVLNTSEVKRWERRGLQAYLNLLQEGSQLSNTPLERWLKKLNLGVSIKAYPNKEQPEGSVISRLKIQEEDSDYEINLSDVGFGASQIIPILIESILANENSLIIIEQPELHLHPEAQATLADLFIECATQGTQFLIETHSEHLMLRFRRRIAETTYDSLKPDHEDFPANEDFPFQKENFGLIYIERKDGQSRVEYVNLDHRGQMVDASRAFRKFFDDDLKEVSFLADVKMAILDIEIEYENVDRS